VSPWISKSRPPPRVRVTGSGFALALASAVAFGVMSYGVHASAPGIPARQLACLRGVLGLALLTPFVWRRLPQVFDPRARWVWIRSGAGALSILCYFWNLQHTSVGTAKALSDFAPIFVALFSARVLRERLGALECAGIALAVGGALALGIPEESAPPLRAVGIGLLGALAASTAYLSLREAAAQYSSALVVWCLCLVSALAALALPGEAWRPLGARGLAFVGLVGVSGLCGQLLMTRAYTALSASVASAIGLTALVWGVLLEVAFDGFRPGWVACASYAAVLSGVGLLQAARARGSASAAPVASASAPVLEPARADPIEP
jgi:drug/metabolite transporter (DMT)-like permease